MEMKYFGLTLVGIIFLAGCAIVPDNLRGVYAVIDWNEKSNDKIWTNQDVDGVVVRTYWKDVNPQQGIYNWSYVDQIFNKALKNDKRIHLIIAPGFYSPKWVLDDTGMKKANFTVPQGPYEGESRPLPLPWDDVYLNNWFKFIDEVAKKYGDNPKLAYISATGPNSHNGEVNLPRERQDELVWLSLVNGTTQEEKKRNLEGLLINAWEKTIDHFCNAFQGKHFTIGLIRESFPIGGDKIVQQEFKQKLVDYGVGQCQQTFGLQTNGLDGRPVYPEEEPMQHWKMIEDYSGVILTGFQTSAPPNLYPSKDPDFEVKILRQVVENAVSIKAHFLEVYESDILDPNKKDVINYAHISLTS